MSEKSDQTGGASLTPLWCSSVGFHTLSVGLKQVENGNVNRISFSSHLMHPLGLKNSPLNNLSYVSCVQLAFVQCMVG